nr:MAG TPA: hypothetical protein [Caudoviricetes sp.]
MRPPGRKVVENQTRKHGRQNSRRSSQRLCRWSTHRVHRRRTRRYNRNPYRHHSRSYSPHRFRRCIQNYSHHRCQTDKPQSAVTEGKKIRLRRVRQHSLLQSKRTGVYACGEWNRID